MKHQRWVCEQCEETQPQGSEGDYCYSCGKQVRKEQRCVWCAKWVPSGRFCRECGCEQVAENLYGAARILKSLGIDQLTLKDRLSSMDSEQVQHYESMYHRHLNAVIKRGEEAQACEPYLIGHNFFRSIEDELTGQLPFNEADFKKYNGGPQGPFSSEPACLLDIVKNSPLQQNQILAQVALIRCGKAGATTQDWWKALDRLEKINTLDDAFSWESALIYGHWRLLLGPIGDRIIEKPQRVIDIARAVLQNNAATVYKPWAALILLSFCTTRLSESERDQVNSLAEKAASSTDNELAFSASVAIGQAAPTGPLLKAIEDKDEWRQLVAALALAKANSSELLPYLEKFSDENLIKIISRCPRQIPVHWKSTLLKLVKTRPDPYELLRLERITLSENDILELSNMAVAKNDQSLMAYLIESGCNESRVILNGVSLIFESKFTNSWNILSEKVPLRIVDFTSVTHGNSDQQTVLTQLSRIQVEEHLSKEFYRLSIGQMLSTSFSDKALNDWAYIVQLAIKLDSDHLNFAPQTVLDYFDSNDQFISLLADFIDRLISSKEYIHNRDKWLQYFLKAYTQELFLELSQDSQIQFTESMLKLVATKSLQTYLRSSAASSLYPNSLPTEIRSKTLNAINQIIGSGLDYDIRYYLEKAIENQ
ncbi:MAG: zinc ribbon domain-containing protein [Candidatus Thiodiazotropha sp.]